MYERGKYALPGLRSHPFVFLAEGLPLSFKLRLTNLLTRPGGTMVRDATASFAFVGSSVRIVRDLKYVQKVHQG